jgi:hypothetical protein
MSIETLGGGGGASYTQLNTRNLCTVRSVTLLVYIRECRLLGCDAVWVTTQKTTSVLVVFCFRAGFDAPGFKPWSMALLTACLWFVLRSGQSQLPQIRHSHPLRNIAEFHLIGLFYRCSVAIPVISHARVDMLYNRTQSALSANCALELHKASCGNVVLCLNSYRCSRVRGISRRNCTLMTI